MLHFPYQSSVSYFFATTPLEMWKGFSFMSGSCPLFYSVCDLRTSKLFSFLSQEEGGSWLGPCIHLCLSTYNMFAFLFQLQFYLSPFQSLIIWHILWAQFFTYLAYAQHCLFMILTGKRAWFGAGACKQIFYQPKWEWVVAGHENSVEI